MHHIHLDQIDSTQKYLKDNWERLFSKHQDILVSANQQIAGVGRRGNTWKGLSNSLFMSFSLKANDVMTLTSLEIGVLIVDFIKQKFSTDLKLKWPNDILTEDGHKCGGILCQVENGFVIVGVGLNLGSHLQSEQPEEETKFPIGYINKDILLETNSQKDLCSELYTYILSNRLSGESVRTKWNAINYHLNTRVKIIDGKIVHEGIFSDIDELGALVLKQDSGELVKIYTGSLWEA